jgi:hypothetical protein
MKTKEAAKIVATLAAAFPNARVTEETSEVYEKLLADLDYDATQKACARLIATSEWFPTIAKIREAVTLLTSGPVRTGAEAYDVVLKAIRAHGPALGTWPEPTFADPLIPKCLGVWGTWNDACESPSDDPGGRARFIDLYDELARRQRQDAVAGRALPAAAPHREFWAARPERSLPAANDPEPAPVLELRTVPRIKHPPPEQRSWTADEINQRLAEGT